MVFDTEVHGLLMYVVLKQPAAMVGCFVSILRFSSALLKTNHPKAALSGYGFLFLQKPLRFHTFF